ncbi:TetR/AcrR family transcriptional regulator [Pseudomonas typographi]|uniref:TetR/AcrR family transcriptional regulator n=1 Tax=Pseudomonas typographi TaxID=2715964 RepID=A0ABR7Z018_9PSED|nr:TetR/AcrR family transcriptional regulator [Pseudomonas typographi]MBD1550541.1 TetR/AcrR family transcriptional regulator [Pseudomonas typographi]MBD1586871.1 TetR/AcrR family transcriptional regulator [Pseudomonas typographi]MBD1598767.1 TetR/AcrR family transcriptional regulator [Pseudomonas typographi]
MKASLREHILDVAEELFYAQGTRAVGIDRIIAEADIAKATLYAHFNSKHALILAYLQRRSDRVLGFMGDTIHATAGESAKSVVMAMFDVLQHNTGVDSPFRGCAFMLAVAENAGDEPIRNIAISHKQAVSELFRSVIGADTPGAQRLAEQIALCYEGALSTIAIHKSNRCIEAAKASIENCFKIAADPM